MNRKNTIIGIFIIIVLLAVSFLVYQFIFDKIKQEIVNTQTRELTEEEKITNQQIAEINALRKQFLEDQAREQLTNSPQEQIKSMDILRNKAIKQPAIQLKKTVSEQLDELAALRAQSIENQSQ